jgi:hypothetical protein
LGGAAATGDVSGVACGPIAAEAGLGTDDGTGAGAAAGVGELASGCAELPEMRGIDFGERSFLDGLTNTVKMPGSSTEVTNPH